MENNQQNQQPHSFTQQQNDAEYALRFYFMQQGQNINKCNSILQSGLVIRGFKIFISVLLELLMYLLFIGAILLIILIPSDPMTVDNQINENASLTVGLHSDLVTGIMMTTKLTIFIFSFPVLFCAILLRRNRKKSTLIARAADETGEMKKNFDVAMQHFRF
ncbi:MAG: hypothetical protein M3R17_13915 [Bacteroidota bacterium]|nr:hypothetical protein [Bacteroidota bacterium]